jgi:hypothetical protein
MLDRLTVRNMSFAREVDGTTPLMAACARGNHMVVQLLMDLRERSLFLQNFFGSTYTSTPGGVHSDGHHFGHKV